MPKSIIPFVVALALAFSSGAHAATNVFHGVIQDDGLGAEIFQPDGVFEVGGGRYRFEFASDAAPLSGGAFVRQFFHVHFYDAGGNEIGGSDGDDVFNRFISDPAAGLTFTSKGFFGYFEVPRSYTDPNGVDGGYDEWDFKAQTGLTMSFADDAVGAAYTYRLTAVPEPATWAMMIIGFGLAGSGLRRERKAAALA
ncbi:MAG: PEPxxWA-CTERM sorting domain-containing protein [Pseudomonadota bacterium]